MTVSKLPRLLGACLLGVPLLLAPGFSLADDHEEPAEQSVTGQAAATHAKSASANVDQLLNALDLPKRAKESRQQGVSEEKVQEILKSAKDKNVDPGDLEEALEVENDSIDKEGKENFGSFVKQQIDSGLNGKALAEAIKAEKKARGLDKKPKGKMKGAAAKAATVDADEAKSAAGDKMGKKKMSEKSKDGKQKAQEMKQKGQAKKADAMNKGKGKSE